MPVREWREACRTDSQHMVNLSAYVWAASFVDWSSHPRVLDIACGGGFGSEYCARQAGIVVGVDYNEEAVRHASVHNRHPKLMFVRGDGTALPFSERSFDVVLSFETIEHIAEDQQFLAELERVLNHNGLLVMSTPHGRRPGRPPDNPYHVREYPLHEFLKLLDCRFTNVRLFGRRLREDLRQLEADFNSVRRFDPFGLRRLIPRRLRHRIGSLVSQARGGLGLDELSPDQVEYIEGLEDTPTLLAVCQKRGPTY